MFSQEKTGIWGVSVVWVRVCESVSTHLWNRSRQQGEKNTDRDKVSLYNIQLEKGMLQLRKDVLKNHNEQRCNVQAWKVPGSV